MNPSQRKSTKPQKSGGKKSDKKSQSSKLPWKTQALWNAHNNGQPIPGFRLSGGTRSRFDKTPKFPPHTLLSSRRSSHIGTSSGSMKPGDSHISIGSRGHLGQSLRVSGTEYIGAVAMPADADATGGVYLNRQNVAGPTTTRLAQFAEIYQRWHAIKYTYRFTSSLPTSTPGTIIMAQDSDPVTIYDNLADGNVSRWRTLPGSVMFQAWQNASCNLPSSGDYTSLWTQDSDSKSTDANDRLDMAGQLWVGCVAPTGLDSGAVLGIIELDYTIEFYSPKLSLLAAERAAEFLFNKDQFDSIFPSGGIEAIFDNIVQYIKTISTTALSTGLASLFKQYVGYDEALGFARKNGNTSVNPGSWGFTPGLYKIQVTHLTNTVHATAADDALSLPTPNSSGVSYANSFCASTRPFQMTQYTSPDGVFAYAYVYSVEFGVRKQRGMYDFAATSITSKFLSGDRLLVQIQTAGTPSLVDFTGKRPVVRQKSTLCPPPSLSSPSFHEEEKIPRYSSENDDIEWAIPRLSTSSSSSTSATPRTGKVVSSNSSDSFEHKKLSNKK